MRKVWNLSENWMFCLNDESFGQAKQVDIPHDWAIDRPIRQDVAQGHNQGYFDRWGIGYYKHTFTLENINWEKVYELAFSGVYENCKVYLNGSLVAQNNYGYTPFSAEINDAIQEGENEILVVTDNRQVPVDRWYAGAGIYRKVQLIERSANYIDASAVYITQQVTEGYAKLFISTGQEGKIRAQLFDRATCVAELVAGNSLELELEKPNLWSAESPYLYILKLDLFQEKEVVDSIEYKIGFRDIHWDAEQGLFINGQATKLKGVCLHQDVGCRGIAAKAEIWRERFEILKETECNAIRFAHHMPAEELLDLCDEMGFYVYEEAFDKWRGGLYARYFDMDWQKDLDAMILRDRNRACVIMWGVGNEVEHQGEDSMIPILEMLTNHVRKVDPSRFVSYAMNPHFKYESNIKAKNVEDIQKFVDEVDDREVYDVDEKIRRIARIARYVDIISCNYQEQWYERIREACPDKLILGTEVYPYYRGASSHEKSFTEDNPALEPLRHDFVVGSFLWAGIDYLGESVVWPSKGWGASLLKTNHVKRPTFYMMQSYWSDKPMVHISVIDYSLPDEGVKEAWSTPPLADHWYFPHYRKMMIPYFIMSNCEEVELYLNGERIYTEDANARDGIIRGYLPWSAGVLEVFGINNGQRVCEHRLETPGQATSLHFLESEIVVSGEDAFEKILIVEARDDKNCFCFQEQANVQFVIEGEGTILGTDNGNLMDHSPYASPNTNLYQGRASCHVRLRQGEKRAIIHAYAGHMRTTTIEIRRE